MDVPVLLVVYRRADLTARTLAAIGAARPRRLLVAADGPASEADRAACEAARAAATAVTWPCDVLTDFAVENMGCEARMFSAVDWLFAQAERGIVLEDDCVPAPDFFPFCDALLEHYRDDRRVMHISGETYATEAAPESYSFSKYALTWGWATWKRAWELCDRRLTGWPALRERPELQALFDTRDERAYLMSTFQQQAEGRPNWDYAWWYTCMTNGLSIHPSVNLVTNIGSDPRATHTAGERLCHRDYGALTFPLRHPPAVLRNPAADVATFDRRLVGDILKHQRTWRHQAGRPGRWLRRALRRRH
jgi:hypothetical protein